MDVRQTDLNFFLNKLRRGIAFSFSCWGDDEWRSVLGRQDGTSRLGQTFFPGMGDGLRQVLISRPTYLLGIRRSASKTLSASIQQWLQRHRLWNTLRWHDADVFHSAASRGRLAPLTETLRKLDLVLVGQDRLKRLKPVLPYRKFVDVPPREAYLSKSRIVRDVLEAVEGRQNVVISVSAGISGKLILDELHRRLGYKHTLVDFGDLWEPLVLPRQRTG